MAEHTVRFKVPYRDLGRADIKFKVYSGSGEESDLLGTLLVSHGAIEWRPRDKKKKIKKSWDDFDKLMMTQSRTR